MERLWSNQSLSAALTASVLGVLHVVWTVVRRIEVGPLSLELPILDSIDWAAQHCRHTRALRCSRCHSA
jgi:chromate transporter